MISLRELEKRIAVGISRNYSNICSDNVPNLEFPKNFWKITHITKKINELKNKIMSKSKDFVNLLSRQQIKKFPKKSFTRNCRITNKSEINYKKKSQNHLRYTKKNKIPKTIPKLNCKCSKVFCLWES